MAFLVSVPSICGGLAICAIVAAGHLASPQLPQGSAAPQSIASTGADAFNTALQKPMLSTAVPPRRPAIDLGSVRVGDQDGVSSSQDNAQGTHVPDKINLRLVYAARILVPRGSLLNVVIKDASNNVVFSQSRPTDRDAPPYDITASLHTDSTFPLSVAVKLKSSAGHTFEREVQVDSNQQYSNSPFLISMRLR